MSDIIKQWIQEKLGIIINLTPESFCDLTRDGFLLSKILRSYEIINEDQFKMIYKTDEKHLCIQNFQLHIVNWLKIINIRLSEEEVNDIVECRGLASVSLFYRMFLELHEKSCLTFITKNRLGEKFRQPIPKYTVVRVKENPFDKLNKIDNKYKEQVEHSYDVIHWLQDRFEMVVSRCKVAREEYLSLIRNSDRKISTTFSVPHNLYSTDEYTTTNIDSPISIDMTYEQLMEENRRCRANTFQPPPPPPNVHEAKEILEKIRKKLKHKQENEVFRKELEQYIRKVFWDKIRIEETKDFHKDITETMLKQSLYEKQMLRKLQEVKQQKEVMMKSKKIISDQILKEKESLFVEKLLEREAEFNRNEFQYYLEKERANQLHKALRKEVLRIKEEKKLKTISDTLKMICDVAVKYSEYQSYFGETPSKLVTDTWNKQIITGQTIFNDNEYSMVDLIDDKAQMPETIRHKAIQKQDVLDEKDFASYLSFEWPWLLSNIDLTEEMHYEMKCGMNVLGRAVHLLLNEKYPLPVFPEPPDLPKVTFRVCVNGIPDTTCLPMLRKLLEHKKILVLELQDVINYCVGAYKKELSVDEEDDDEEENGEEKPVKENAPKKGKKEKALKKPKKSESIKEYTVETAVKKVQTPRIYPCEQILFSPPAELGRIAEEELSKGNSLTDYLLISMFIEYLLVQNDFEGWVLINYPTNFEQAVLLEEGLSGLKVPGVEESCKIYKSLIDIVYLCDQDETPEKEDERRYSKLLVDPSESIDPPPYDTVLTAFINVCPDDEEERDKDDEEASNEESEDPPTLQLQQFYSDMGCNYTLYYKSFEYTTIKQLGKLIIGDFSLPPKSSIELFGDTVRYIEAEKLVDYRTSVYVKSGEKIERERIEKVLKQPEMSVDESNDKKGKKDKGKKGKKDATETSAKGGKGKNVIIVREDKTTQIPEVTIIEIEEEEVEEETKPGETGWSYLNLTLSDKISPIITQFWEHLESVFFNDFTQVLFIKKLLINSVMPYTIYIKSFMSKHNKKPDDRQIYLLKFQENFNQFDDDFRRDKEFKSELHCLINELKNKLLDMSDKKMIEGEQERHILIRKSWGPRQLIEIVNNYICGFQLEFDRHVDTLIFINDYFTGLITQVLSEEEIPKEIIPKIELENKVIHNIINDYLLSVDETNTVNLELIKEKLITFYHATETAVRKRHSYVFTCYEKAKQLFNPEINSKGKPKPKKKEKGKTLLTIFEPSEKVKRSSDKIFDEWLCALKGEIARIVIYFQLLKYDMFQNVEMFVNSLKKLFYGVFNDIKTRYNKEVDCINKACHILSIAVENEVPIKEELVFVDDEFLISADVFVSEPTPEKIPEIISDDLVFTIPQLRSLTRVLYDLAQEGFMPHQMFTFIIQDVVANDEELMVPTTWKKLNGYNVTELSKRMFPDQNWVHWKDFILNNLTIPMPTDDEIITLRNEFLKFDPYSTELVYKQDLENVHFWFDDFCIATESWLIKRLLYKMYNVRQQFNYSALLLDLCKGQCTQEGIAKALAILGGKKVCWNNDTGKMYVEEILEKRKIHDEEVRLREEELREHRKFAETIIDDLIDTTVHTCDSVVITEIPLEEEENEEDEIKPLDDENVDMTKTVPSKQNIRQGRCKSNSDETKIRESYLSKEETKEIKSSKDAKKKQHISETNAAAKVEGSQSSIKKKHSKNERNSKESPHSSLLKPHSKLKHVSDHKVTSKNKLVSTDIINEIIDEMMFPEDPCESLASSEPESLVPHFSNISIGFEPQISPPLRYFLLFEDIATVLMKSLSDVLSSDDKQFFDKVCDIYEECKNPEFNNEVLCHEFLNNKTFLQLMERQTKFIIQSPGTIVQDIINERDDPYQLIQ